MNKTKQITTEKKYRLSAKNLFLTYSNCQIEIKEALDQLKKKLSHYIIKDYIIVREFHEDGNPHIHVYLNLNRQFNTYNPCYLDLDAGNGTYCHGKYESARSPNFVIEYILKNVNDKYDPNVLFSPNLSDRIDLLGTFMSLGESVIALARQGKIEEALNLYEKDKPLEFVKSHTTLEKSLRGLYLKARGFQTKFNFKDYIIPEDLNNLLTHYNKGKTLVLIGSPGSGKTQMITSFLTQVVSLKPLIVNNFDSIRFFDNKIHNAIVFDDCAWDPLMAREYLIKLVDSEVPTTHNIKHGSVMIDKPTPRVVIVNSTDPWVSSLEFNSFGGPENPYKDPAVTRRVTIYVLDSNKSLIPENPVVKAD